MPLRTIARITALSPGQSPPPVRMPSLHGAQHYGPTLGRDARTLPRPRAPRRPARSCTAACGRDDGVEESAHRRRLADGLLQPAAARARSPRVSRDVVRAEKLALREARGRAGVYNVNYVSLDSSDPETGRWDPGRVAANAREAVQTPNTIAYLGELEPGASAISLPILNEAGILQVSPRDTFARPDRAGRPRRARELLPLGRRELHPRGAAVAIARRSCSSTPCATQGVRRLALADDRRLAGTTSADRVGRLARARPGIEVVGRARLDSAGDRCPRASARTSAASARMPSCTPARPPTSRSARCAACTRADPRVGLLGGDELTLAPDLPRRLGAAADGGSSSRASTPRRGRGFERRFARRVRREPPDRQAVLGLPRDAARARRGAASPASDAREPPGGRRHGRRQPPGTRCALRAVPRPRAPGWSASDRPCKLARRFWS